MEKRTAHEQTPTRCCCRLQDDPIPTKETLLFSVSSYWQKYKSHGGTCYYSAVAMIL